MIANVDAISACRSWSIREAVYLHNGESYFVRELDLEGKVAYVERHEMDYYTQAVLESSVVITRETSSAHVSQSLLAYGEVDVTWQTVAFKKIKFYSREISGKGRSTFPRSDCPPPRWLSPERA